MTSVPYALSESPLPRLGLIVLQVDETIEEDFRRLVPPDMARLHVTRVPSGADLTPATIAAMADQLPAAAALLPPAADLDVVGYACTSGTTLIGAERVTTLVRGSTRTRHVTNPLTAACAAMQYLGLQRIALVSPYIASVADPIRHAFEARGIAVPETLSFGEQVEARVARIDPASVAQAALDLGRRPGVDGVFLSCTNLRTLGIIPEVEVTLGKPVLSSNRVLAWHMARLAGLADVVI